MSGFYSKCLVNYNDLNGYDSIQNMAKELFEKNEGNPELAEILDDLKTLIQSEKGIQQLMHDPKYLPAKLMLHDALVSDLSQYMIGDEGYVPESCYYTAEYEAYPEIAEEMILGESDPDKIIEFADGMLNYATETAKSILVRGGLFGKILDDKFLAENGPNTSGADDMRDAFIILNNEFSAWSRICFFNGCFIKNYPDSYELESIHKKPEDYILINLLFK